jgi:hypothetical protein
MKSLSLETWQRSGKTNEEETPVTPKEVQLQAVAQEKLYTQNTVVSGSMGEKGFTWENCRDSPDLADFFVGAMTHEMKDMECGIKARDKRIGQLELALNKINDIRNSIIGYQKINWSAHIYPLVDALNEIGIVGKNYDKAKNVAQTQVERIAELEARENELLHALEDLQAAWIAARDVSGGLCCVTPTASCDCARCKNYDWGWRATLDPLEED